MTEIYASVYVDNETSEDMFIRRDGLWFMRCKHFDMPTKIAYYCMSAKANLGQRLLMIDKETLSEEYIGGFDYAEK